MTVPFCSFSPPTVLPLAAFDRPGQIMTAKRMKTKWTDRQMVGQSEGSERVHRIQVVFLLPCRQSPVSSRGRPPDAAAKRSRGNSFLNLSDSLLPKLDSIAVTHRSNTYLSHVARAVLLTRKLILVNYATGKFNTTFVEECKLWKDCNKQKAHFSKP